MAIPTDSTTAKLFLNTSEGSANFIKILPFEELDKPGEVDQSNVEVFYKT